MGRRVGVVLFGVGFGCGCAVLVWFLARQSLADAGAWAGIIGLAVGVLLGGVSVVLAWPKVSRLAGVPTGSDFPGVTQTVTASSGGIANVVGMGIQTIRGSGEATQRRPDGSPRARGADDDTSERGEA